jgi:hypothetical protein
MFHVSVSVCGKYHGLPVCLSFILGLKDNKIFRKSGRSRVSVG